MVTHNGFFVPVNTMLIKTHMVATPPTNAANAPNARAALREEDVPSTWGKDESSDDDTHIPRDWKLYSPTNETLMVPAWVIDATLMNRHDDVAREERTNPTKDRHHKVILTPTGELISHNGF
mmetsp:Transcript_37970/g.81137  ORF Transcript_37970/g.81137 Transcript_37970/m.81137 type:complete len:122 (+) Transcript_37970:593-958(+)